MLCIRADDCVSIVAPSVMGRGETGLVALRKRGRVAGERDTTCSTCYVDLDAWVGKVVE